MELTTLPDDAKCITNAVLTAGNRVRQGWKTPDGRYFETFHYPCALNFQQILELGGTPEWAAAVSTAGVEGE